MELFEQIRRDHKHEELSIHALAKRHAVHRRTVRQALASAVPPARKQHRRRQAPALGRHHQFIDEILIADEKAPRKQRHTAKRIHARLLQERDAAVSERAVRAYVARRKRELGIAANAFVPQAYDPADQAQVDWGEFDAVVDGQLQTLNLFLMRSSYSGATFARAYPCQTQQAFLDAHVRAFAWFGGVFSCLRYDNLSAAVKKVLRGHRRIETDRFVALRSHYGFESSFTTPGKDGAHEKGGVEGEVGRFRRNHLVPVPTVDSLDELNDLIGRASTSDLKRTIAGRDEPVEAFVAKERRRLAGLPAEPFDAAERVRARVSQKSLVTVKQCHYSVPVSLAGLAVEARLGATQVEVFHDGKMVARHERLTKQHEISAVLDHYLELLRERPGAFAGSLALAQQRRRGGWPECFDELWRGIETRYDKTTAARQMVDVLLLCRELGADAVEHAVRGALACGAHDGGAVAVLARQTKPRPAGAIELTARLAAVGSAPGSLDCYDVLIGGAA